MAADVVLLLAAKVGVLAAVAAGVVLAENVGVMAAVGLRWRAPLGNAEEGEGKVTEEEEAAKNETPGFGFEEEVAPSLSLDRTSVLAGLASSSSKSREVGE